MLTQVDPGDFAGSPVAKTPLCQCRRHGFNPRPLFREIRSHMPCSVVIIFKKKKRKIALARNPWLGCNQLEHWKRDRSSKRLCKNFNVNSNALMGLPRWLRGNESAFNEGDMGLTPTLGRSPGVGNVNPLQYSCQEKFHGQENLVSYSPWGSKELHTTECAPWHCTNSVTPNPSNGSLLDWSRLWEIFS